MAAVVNSQRRRSIATSGAAACGGYLRAAVNCYWIAWIVAAALVPLDPGWGAALPAHEIAFFESKIRPLLAEHCYSCHSAEADKLKGGLRVDSLQGLLQGGDSGAAIVPGAAAESLLIRAVSYEDPNLQMPPKGKQLSKRQVADLTRWIQAGALWPAAAADPGSHATSAASSPTAAISAEDRDWWSFRPVRRPQPPSSAQLPAGANPIDAFVRAGLETKGLRPNPPASRRELIRRAYFDLLGLPPAPEAIAAFEQDRAPEAWDRLVDRLLALPQYGERWGRHWLDVVRYAQSNGYERDGEKPESWRYRDYVVQAFNTDKPYDRFVAEQIAGDELDGATFDSIIATGFQRLGVWDDEPDDKRQAEFDELDDIVATTGGAFLGLTIGCARCHDHKVDPIPQADYYGLLSFFRNLRLNEAAKYTLDSANYVALAAPAAIADWRAAQEAKLSGLQRNLEAAAEAEKKALMQQIQRVKAERPPFAFALAVRERGSNPPPTHVLIRGNPARTGPEVQPAFLQVLGGGRPSIETAATSAASSGRRRALACWVASPENPLTARVLVNRIWHHHFGRGLVRTTSDFGRGGALPTHPELLDWLAAEFVEQGWSIKRLHRTILTSYTYRMSSRADNVGAAAIDPANDKLWRQNLRRLEAEALRDSVLAISGQLNLTMGGRGFFPRLTGEVLAGQSRPGLDWDLSKPAELARRSVYVYVRRTMPVPMLEAFDYSNTAAPLTERPLTTVAPQALLLLNDAFMAEQAAAFAERLRREGGEQANLDAGRVRRAFQLAIGREPTAREQDLALDFIRRQRMAFADLDRRLTFRPDVPVSLSVEYLEKLRPDQFLIGPATGWSYHRGLWSKAYEGIRTLDRERGPFALADGARFADGTIRARIAPGTACEAAGLLFRAAVADGALRGYEVVFEPRERRVALRRHTAEIRVLAEVKADSPMLNGVSIRVELQQARVGVWLGDNPEPVFDVTDSEPILAVGQVGVRSWGAAVHVDHLELQPHGSAPIDLRDSAAVCNDRRAMEAFCLLLLNLNEVIYID